jgi:predicted DNA-binding protein (UPF0251 family)
MRHFKFHSIPRPTKAQFNACLDEFAELLSRDLDIDEAADRMGITRGTSCALLLHLRCRLGSQAI